MVRPSYKPKIIPGKGILVDVAAQSSKESAGRHEYSLSRNSFRELERRTHKRGIHVDLAERSRKESTVRHAYSVSWNSFRFTSETKDPMSAVGTSHTKAQAQPATIIHRTYGALRWHPVQRPGMNSGITI
jgi:hypothetical protein